MRSSGLICSFLVLSASAWAADTDGTKYVSDYDWSSTPAASLGSPGPKTVNLAACPAGVIGKQREYWVYISGSGPAEAVQVTGGTCNGDGSPGTLQFTTQQAHGNAYKLGSASSGLQEASRAAAFAPTNPQGTVQSGRVVIPPGSELKLYARVSLRSSAQTVDFTGSIVECHMADTCIFVGDPQNSNLISSVTLINPRGRPMVVGGRHPFLEVNGQQTRIFNVSTRVALSGAFFSSYVQVDDDQAFLLDGLATGLGASQGNYGVRCDTTECDPVVYAPGPFNKYSAVGWLKNLNISMQCHGNGIDWQSGNTLRISDSVIQGYAQYGVRGGTRRGGYGGLELDNVYEEVGKCSNPSGTVGQAGVIAQGGRLKIGGGEGPTGAFPVFAHNGTTDYRYYIVAHAALGVSNPLYAGKALTSGTGPVTVTSPDIEGAESFDLLRVSPTPGSREQAPFGTGPYAVATNVPRSSSCAKGVCTFTDSQAALKSYTLAPPNFFPLLDFWPGNIVLGSNRDSGTVLSVATANVDVASSGIVALQGMAGPAVSAGECAGITSWSPVWITCVAQKLPPSSFYEQGALLLAVKPQHDGGKATGLKGRMNFATVGTGPGHIITFSDSNFEKTVATANNRPTSDPNDAYVGYDQVSSNPADVGMSLGAPKSISSYIGNAGDGTGWKERLTAEKKAFAVPIVISEGNTLTLGSGTALSQMRIFRTTGISGTTVPPQRCVDVKEATQGLIATDQITSVTPPGPLGNLSLNAYAGPGAVILHFCNPSGNPAAAPAGAYVFLAVH